MHATSAKIEFTVHARTCVNKRGVFAIIGVACRATPVETTADFETTSSHVHTLKQWVLYWKRAAYGLMSIFQVCVSPILAFNP